MTSPPPPFDQYTRPPPALSLESPPSSSPAPSPDTWLHHCKTNPLQSSPKGPYSPLSLPSPPPIRAANTHKSLFLSTMNQFQGRWHHSHLLVRYLPKAFWGTDSHRASNVWARWPMGVDNCLHPLNRHPQRFLT